MSGMIESEENRVYKNRKNGAVTLHIAPEKLGIATGNQGMKKVDSYDGFNNCYRNIILDSVHTDEDEPIVEIGENNDYTQIYNVDIHDCDFEI